MTDEPKKKKSESKKLIALRDTACVIRGAVHPLSAGEDITDCGLSEAELRAQGVPFREA